MKRTLALLTALLLASLAALHTAEPFPEIKPLLGERGDVVFAEAFDGPNAKPLEVIPAAKCVLVDTIKISALR